VEKQYMIVLGLLNVVLYPSLSQTYENLEIIKLIIFKIVLALNKYKNIYLFQASRIIDCRPTAHIEKQSEAANEHKL